MTALINKNMPSDLFDNLKIHNFLIKIKQNDYNNDITSLIDDIFSVLASRMFESPRAVYKCYYVDMMENERGDILPNTISNPFIFMDCNPDGVFYPCGMVMDNQNYYISYGNHDDSSYIIRMDKSHVDSLKKLIKIRNNIPYFYTNGSSLIFYEYFKKSKDDLLSLFGFLFEHIINSGGLVKSSDILNELIVLYENIIWEFDR
jgi:hypothetical protein